MILLMRIDYRRFNRPIVVFPAVAVTTLLLLGVFLLRDSHNTHRWIRFGGSSPFSHRRLPSPCWCCFSPGFCRTSCIPFATGATRCCRRLLPSLVFILLIVKEPDLGTALVCAAVTALMFYLAGAETKYFGYAVLAAAPVLYFLLFRVPWRRARMLAFLNPDADPQGSGFHTIQSLIAVGTGGIRGLGFMEGRQKLFYLPQPHTDFIFANIAEELGLIGALAIIALFVALGYRGLRAASLSKDVFARFLAFGITATILIQAFFNISVVLALVPTKGITLPFISSRRHVSVHHPGQHRRAVESHPGDRLTGMRVMIAGGGTGGHVIPALAIAGALKSAYAAEVCFIGTARGMETRLVPQAGYALELIDVGQLNRVSLATQLKTLVALPRGIFHCLRSFTPLAAAGGGRCRRLRFRAGYAGGAAATRADSGL